MKKLAGKVFRFLVFPLLIICVLFAVYVAGLNLYIRYAPYALPQPTGKTPDISKFTPKADSPLSLVEQQQIWVAEEYLFDHAGTYHNPQQGHDILDKLVEFGSKTVAHKALEIRLRDAWMCTDNIPFIYQFGDWRLHRLALITPVGDTEMKRLYAYWQKLYEQDQRFADILLKRLNQSLCMVKNPHYEDTFGKHVGGM